MLGCAYVTLGVVAYVTLEGGVIHHFYEHCIVGKIKTNEEDIEFAW